MCQQSIVKSQHGLANLIRNRALIIVSTVLEVHEHVDLHNSKYVTH